jgi:hypothetical protein
MPITLSVEEEMTHKHGRGKSEKSVKSRAGRFACWLRLRAGVRRDVYSASKR